VQVLLEQGAPPDVPDDRLASLPFVVVGMTPGIPDVAWLRLCDVVIQQGDPALAQVAQNVSDHPITATTLALLLRSQRGRSIGEGLVAESSAYSVLQSGPEFAAWRAAHPPRADRDVGARVRVEREGATLRVVLTRPARLNALDRQMRDELVEALALATADPSITLVELHGEGSSFSAGGDLDEFGTRADPATAHLLRLQRSVARTLAGLDKPTVAHVHGACMGSGIELAAFCDTIVAARNTKIALPEIGLGLVPGAGGTVSLTRRIGRLHTAWLAFSGCTIDAVTAHSWGLVDHLEP
jgi:hypothetical protein